jgi:glycosyltransferase involved in cell wall biosynthesis
MIIPVYNEEQALPLFWEALHAVLKGLGETHEVILIDDGSADKSWPVIRELSNRYPNIRGVRFTRNFGKEAAIQIGLEKASGSR